MLYARELFIPTRNQRLIEKMTAISKTSRGIPAGPKLRAPKAAEVRSKIQASVLITRLEKHAAGQIDMSPTQVRAAEVLLRKILPDLQSAELRHYDETESMTEDQLAQRLAATLAALPAELRALVIGDAMADAP